MDDLDYNYLLGDPTDTYFELFFRLFCEEYEGIDEGFCVEMESRQVFEFLTARVL